jgi:hypothetical protein
VWSRGVRAATHELDLERVSGRGERSFVSDDLPNRKSSINVASEDRGNSVEHSCLENRERPLPCLFSGLKHDEHITFSWTLGE